MPAKIAHSVSFIVPALNEEVVVEQVIRDIWTTVDERIATYEIILIDDGSTDRTGEIMQRLAEELPNVRLVSNGRNIGLGGSYQKGVKEARLEYVMMMCGDGGVPATSLPPIIDKIGSADIVAPYMVNLRTIKTPMRYAISRCYTTLLNLISGQRLNYYNGLPVHRRALLRQIEITSSGFGFQGEILVKLIKSGCSVVEVGVHGAEATNKSSVFRIRNLVSVTKTLLKLMRELVGFRAIRWPADDPRAEEHRKA
jgi:glycosyltransferase involved in cell wall biosynthesis